MSEPVLGPIADVLAGVLSLYVQLLAFLLSRAMVSGLLAGRERGARRLAYAVAALCALHLSLGLLLPFAHDGLLLSPLFSLWAMLASLALLVLALGFATAIGLMAGRSGTPHAQPIGKAGHLKLMLLSHALTIAIVLGGISILAAQHQRNSLRTEICAALDGKLNAEWKDRTSRLRASRAASEEGRRGAQFLQDREIDGKPSLSVGEFFRGQAIPAAGSTHDGSTDAGALSRDRHLPA